ncbi:MAG: hypothetical protein ACI976_001725 [Aureispira sp.]|jgi:hypothetical protein
MKKTLKIRLFLLLPYLLFLGKSTTTQAQTKTISEAELIEIIRPKIEQHITKPWKKAILSYLNEEKFGGYGVTVSDSANQEYTLNPGEYSLNFEESNTLNQFILQKHQKKACNTLHITLYPDKTYHIKTTWDVKKHKVQLRYAKSEEEELKKILPANTTNTPLDMTRYTKTAISKSKEKVKRLPINEDIFCAFYVRLYALLGDPKQIDFEGFYYSIYDKENDFYFSANLTGFGASYSAADDSKRSKKLIEEFHALLFSEQLVLKECSLEYEHDFGVTKYGFKEGQFINETTSD